MLNFKFNYITLRPVLQSPKETSWYWSHTHRECEAISLRFQGGRKRGNYSRVVLHLMCLLQVSWPPRDLYPSLRSHLTQPCSSVGLGVVVVVVEEEVANFFFHSFSIHPQIQLLAQKKAHSKKIYLTIICDYTKLRKWFCGTFLIFWFFRNEMF